MQIIPFTEGRFPVQMLFPEILHTNVPSLVSLGNNEIIECVSLKEALQTGQASRGDFYESSLLLREYLSALSSLCLTLNSETPGLTRLFLLSFFWKM